MEDQVYTPEEVAKILKVHYKTVMRMIHDKKIKAIDISLGMNQRANWRIPATSINKLLKKGGETTR